MAEKPNLFRTKKIASCKHLIMSAELDGFLIRIIILTMEACLRPKIHPGEKLPLINSLIMQYRKIQTEVQVCSLDDLTETEKQLVEDARQAARDSYSPYSHFHVGAALKLDNGETITGNNQENVAYPSGLCAERTALFYAHARFPHSSPVALAVAACTDDGVFTPLPVTPCGGCRQVMAEYEKLAGHPVTVILYAEKEIYRLDQAVYLLPLSFSF